jgi:hypothetical protein
VPRKKILARVLAHAVCAPDDSASSVNATIRDHFSDSVFPLASIQNVLAADCAGGSEGAMKSTSNL